MTRRLVLVEVDAETPLEAERLVGLALAKSLHGFYFVHQTTVEVAPC